MQIDYCGRNERYNELRMRHRAGLITFTAAIRLVGTIYWLSHWALEDCYAMTGGGTRLPGGCSKFPSFSTEYVYVLPTTLAAIVFVLIDEAVS